MCRLGAAAYGVPGVEARAVGRWHSARSAAITFSLGRRAERPVRELATLALVAGVAAARALRALGVDVSLKCPNDLILGGVKLGGILVETRSGNFAAVGI